MGDCCLLKHNVEWEVAVVVQRLVWLRMLRSKLDSVRPFRNVYLFHA